MKQINLASLQVTLAFGGFLFWFLVILHVHCGGMSPWWHKRKAWFQHMFSCSGLFKPAVSCLQLTQRTPEKCSLQLIVCRYAGDCIWLIGVERDLWLHQSGSSYMIEAKPLVTHVDTYWEVSTMSVEHNAAVVTAHSIHCSCMQRFPLQTHSLNTSAEIRNSPTVWLLWHEDFIKDRWKNEWDLYHMASECCSQRACRVRRFWKLIWQRAITHGRFI